jgi:hypothetical protein
MIAHLWNRHGYALGGREFIIWKDILSIIFIIYFLDEFPIVVGILRLLFTGRNV